MRLEASIIAEAFLLSFAAVSFAAETNPAPQKTVPARSMLTMGGIASTPERRASPLFTGSRLPVPPMQSAPWEPAESSLPANYTSAAASLFQQGLADPRGCECREIEVGAGSVWGGDAGVVSTRGWVLPGDGAQRFAVCWNGLVYPLVSVGTNANLDADMAMAETNGLATWFSAIPEPMSVSQNSLLGIKGCFLWRLGKPDLARRFWVVQAARADRSRAAMGPPPTSGSEAKLPEADPYLGWASDWAWAMFDRTICAHMRGDEKLALLTARQLAEAQPKIEAECARRGFKRQPYFDSARQGQTQPYLDFLEQFPELLADLERRDKEGPRVSILSSGIANIPAPSERIAALVRDLDLVNARQWGQPGSVNLAEDPVVSALIGEGGAAVEPLLECAEHDKRLTRSVSFGRDFHRGRTVLKVRSAAWIALETILQARFSSLSEARAYWNKYQGLKLEDRWYVMLNDDSARARWLEAAGCIVQPTNVTTFPGGYSAIGHVPTNAPVPLRGERLRTKTGPSVTELLRRHALELPTNNIGGYDLGFACQMALYLADWDSQAALPVARALSKRVCAVMKHSEQQLGHFVVKLSLARAGAGDPQAFDDYADWLVTTTPEQLDHLIAESLEPLEQFPTNAVLQAAAGKIFGDTNSAWGRLPWKGSFFGAIVDTTLLAVPAYRLLISRELEKTNVCGKITYQESGHLSYEIQSYQSGSRMLTFPEGAQPTKGATSDLRWCDWIALLLANENQIPFFNPFATLEKRDAAIREAQSKLSTPER